MKVIKWLAALVGLVVALFIVAIIVIPIFVDPNDYREQIGELVKEKTGRELTIEGEIELSLFPWIGIELGKMELGNAKGFGPTPMARLSEMDVKVKLMPLLGKKVEMDTIVVRGLELSLGRDKKGVANWDDLIAQEGDVKSEPEVGEDKAASSGMELAALAVGGLKVEKGRVIWDDRSSGQRVEISNLDLTSGSVTFDVPFPVELDFDLNNSNPEIKGHIHLTTRALINLNEQRFQFSDSSLATKLAGAVFPGGKLDSELQSDIEANLKQQTASVNNLSLVTMGITLKGQINGKQIIDSPAFSGHLQSEPFVPRDLLDAMQIKLPEMADPSTLTKAKFATDLKGGLNSVALDNLKMQLDQSSLTGKVSVKNFAKPIIRYDLTINEIDADRYLPPPRKEQGQTSKAPTPASAAAGGATELPLELLRSLDIDGTVRLGKLKIMNMRSSEMRATLNARQGLFKLHPLSAKLYQGGYEGNLRFDVRKDTPRLAMDEKLSGVEAGPLLKDFMGKDYVTGKANLSARMTARGLDDKAIRKTLNGNAAFSFQNGMVKGINIAQKIRNAYALYKKQPAAKEEARETDFASLSGTLTIKNGLVRNNDLSAKSPLFRVSGKGTANLVSEKIDYRVRASIVGSLKGQGGKEITELKDMTVPIIIKGSFTEPKFKIDMGSLLEAKAKAKVEKKKKEVEKKLEKKLEEKLREKLKF